MGLTNEELVQKALITTDALAASGKLSPAQSDRFIDYVIQETVLKENARVIRFRAESLEIDKIGIGKRVALPKAEAQDPALRRGISTSKITLTPREIIVPFEISDQFKEVNIEGSAIEDRIISLMARQLANDLEELYINGDLLGPAVLENDIKEGGSTTQYIKDSYLALQDGWLRLADQGNVVDFEGQNVGLSTFSRMLRAMPQKFRRNKANLRFFITGDLSQLYIEKLSSRATALGDASTQGQVHTPFGVRLVDIPLMHFTPKVVEHVVLNGTTPTALRYGPITNVVVTPSNLASTPQTPYILTTDYTVDLTAGTLTRAGAGAIGDGDTVKVTYLAGPQILLTHQENFIIGIGRDIRIEKDRDIYKGMNQYAITAKVGVQFEEATAIVKGVNIGQSV